MRSNQQPKALEGLQKRAIEVSEFQVAAFNHQNFSGKTKCYEFHYSQSQISQKLLSDIAHMEESSSTSEDLIV